MDDLSTNQDLNARKSKLPLCPVCNLEFKRRVKRGMWVKLFLFWYPVKRYFCANCLECYYVSKPKYQGQP